MSAHKLSTVQATLCGYLEAEIAKPSGILSGMKLARERFGTGDASEIINTALSDEGSGIVLFSLFPMASRVDQNSGKRTSILCGLSVLVIDNPQKNMTRNPLEVVEDVWAAVTKQSNKGQQFQLGSSPMDLIDETEASRVYAVNFDVLISVQP